MTATVIYDEVEKDLANARQAGEDLWLQARDLAAATGWEIEPEGICREGMCVPLPSQGRENLLAEGAGGGSLNLTGFARFIGQPYAADRDRSVWYFGSSPSEQRSALLELDAPDFSLPDLEGRMHSLSAQRGKKVLLLLWASW